MLPLLLAMVFFFFLLVGAVVFVACGLIPHTRRYALSAALWCAVWGLCAIVQMLFAGTAVIAGAFLLKSDTSSGLHVPTVSSSVGWGFVCLGLAVCAAVATAVAWTHQVLARRMTFVLFRLYATAVSAGIGSVFGWVLGWWLMSQHIPMPGFFLLWGLSMPILMTSFGATAYNGARSLRGEAPNSYTWISREEFDGI